MNGGKDSGGIKQRDFSCAALSRNDNNVFRVAGAVGGKAPPHHSSAQTSLSFRTSAAK